eukprot:gene13062-biopygen4995
MLPAPQSRERDRPPGVGGAVRAPRGNAQNTPAPPPLGLLGGGIGSRVSQTVNNQEVRTTLLVCSPARDRKGVSLPGCQRGIRVLPGPQGECAAGCPLWPLCSTPPTEGCPLYTPISIRKTEIRPARRRRPSAATAPRAARRVGLEQYTKMPFEQNQSSERDFLKACFPNVHMATWPHGRMAARPQGRMAARPQGRKATWPHGRMAATQGRKAARPQGRKAAWPHGRKARKPRPAHAVKNVAHSGAGPLLAMLLAQGGGAGTEGIGGPECSVHCPVAPAPRPQHREDDPAPGSGARAACGAARAEGEQGETKREQGKARSAKGESGKRTVGKRKANGGNGKLTGNNGDGKRKRTAGNDGFTRRATTAMMHNAACNDVRRARVGLVWRRARLQSSPLGIPSFVPRRGGGAPLESREYPKEG